MIATQDAIELPDDGLLALADLLLDLSEQSATTVEGIDGYPVTVTTST